VAGTLKLNVRIEGANEVLRAFSKLPADATNELRDRTLDVSRELAGKIRSAGEAESRVAARAASTVKAVRDRIPAVQASTTGRARGRKPSKKGSGSGGVLFASEFGMTRKSGWYSKPRYFDSAGRQFRPHGTHSYWFFVTAERNQSWMADQWDKVADAVVRDWSA
jgi:hypothetical protein